jgi:hypothetical protein
MVAVVATTDNFSLGRVVDRTFGVLGRNLAAFVGLSALAQTPTLAMNLLRLRLGIHFFNGVQPDPRVNPWGISVRYLVFELATYLVTTALAYLLYAAITHATISDLTGRRASTADGVRAAFRHAPALVVIAVVSLLGFASGLILLVVPGILLSLAWTVAVPVCVIEQAPILTTFRRSAFLTRGHRWPLFASYLALIVVAFIVELVKFLIVRAGLRPLGSDAMLYVNAILANIFAIGISAASATFVASVYFELRTTKEGIGPEQLAAVFD